MTTASAGFNRSAAFVAALRHPINFLDMWWETKFSVLRLDHNIANFCMIIGMVCAAVSTLFIGPPPTSALNVASPDTVNAICWCIVIGLGIKIQGALSHSRWYFPNTSLRRCYQLGYTGAPIGSAGMLTYGFFLIEHTTTWTSAVGAFVTPLFGVGILLQGGLYWLEARRMERVEKHMIRIAKQFKEIRDQQ